MVGRPDDRAAEHSALHLAKKLARRVGAQRPRHRLPVLGTPAYERGRVRLRDRKHGDAAFSIDPLRASGRDALRVVSEEQAGLRGLIRRLSTGRKGDSHELVDLRLGRGADQRRRAPVGSDLLPAQLQELERLLQALALLLLLRGVERRGSIELP